MSNMEIELDGADQTASTEVNAANAASGEDTSEEDSLIDFNELEVEKAAQKAAERAALKEMLINNGFKFRNLLKEEKVKQHFTSHFRKKMQCLQKTYFRRYRKKTYMK